VAGAGTVLAFFAATKQSATAVCLSEQLQANRRCDLGLINLVFCLMLQDGFTVEVSPQLFQVEVVKSPELPVKQQEQPAKTQEQKPYYVVMFTATWCGPCQNWKNNGGPQKIKAAGYNFTPIDIDANPKWKSKVDRYPTFWIVDHATRNPQYKFLGTTPAETIIAKAEQLAKPAEQRSIYGSVGTSHESRETLIDHLANDGVHRGRHSLAKLQAMTDEQLDSLHNSDHGGRN
jgi:hypothetical protein